MSYSRIIEVIQDNFGFNPDYVVENDILFIRVKGIDNVSLAKYILDKLKCLKITVQDREGYRFSDLGWIKIQYSEKSQLVYTKRTRTCFY